MNGKCCEEEKLAGAILNEIKEDEENEIVMQMICRVKNWQFVQRTTLDEVQIRLNDEDIRMVKANKNRTFIFSNPSIFGFITKTEQEHANRNHD